MYHRACLAGDIRHMQKGLAACCPCGGPFSRKLFYVILVVPHPSGKGAVCIDGGLAPSGKRPGDVKSLLFLVPPDANAKGGTFFYRSTGCGSQRLLRPLSGPCILLAAAPTAPPCFRRWRRSSPLLFRFRGKSLKRSITIRNDRPSFPNTSGHSY